MTRALLMGIGMTLLACGGSTDKPPARAKHQGLSLPHRISNAGFSSPNSVLYDSKSDRYLISNIAGMPLEEDGVAFISRLNPDGSIANLKWIDSASDEITLNAPKGMAILGNELYVADIDHIRVFTRATGKPLRSFRIRSATYLNDLVVNDQGQLFASDTGLRATPKGFSPSGSDAIYRIENDEAVAIAKGRKLGRPTALVFAQGRLGVVTFGRASFFWLDENGQATESINFPNGALAGVACVGHELYAASWEAGGLFSYSMDASSANHKGPRLIISQIGAPTDFAVDTKRGRIIVPLFHDDAVLILKVPAHDSK